MNSSDRLRLGVTALLARPTRTALSTLGIALGIAALVGVLGLSESSRAELNAQLDKLGTNLLSVESTQSGIDGSSPSLPETAPAMIRRIPTVDSATAIRNIPIAKVQKNERIPPYVTGGLQAAAADRNLLKVLGAELHAGHWLDAVGSKYPTVVLGSDAAERLAATVGQRVWIEGHWFSVVGVLEPITLAPSLDAVAFVGLEIAHDYFGNTLPPTTVFTRVQESELEATRQLLGIAANPAAPTDVAVSRPSDALAAKAAADKSLTALTLGLGAVALIVGAVGIANVMVISVLERRREIGVRRALGATRLDIGSQFLSESVLLSLIGGLAGVMIGLALTVIWSLHQGRMLVVPWVPISMGLACSLLIGSVVGLYPAMRAASVPPTEALRAA